MSREYIDCREAILQKLALDLEYGKNSYLGGYIVLLEDIRRFIQSIDIDTMLRSGNDRYSKSLTLHRNWDMDYIEKDECEDQLTIFFYTKNNTFRIEIGNCAYVIEDGEVIHVSEQSIWFEYKIGENCSYTFQKIDGAG